MSFSSKIVTADEQEIKENPAQIWTEISKDGPEFKLFFPFVGWPHSVWWKQHTEIDGQKKDSRRLQTHSHILNVNSEPCSADGNNKNQLYTSGLFPFKIKI